METLFRIPLFYAQSRKSTAYAFHVHHREKQTTALLMPRRHRSIDQIPAILQPDDFAESAIEHIETHISRSAHPLSGKCAASCSSSWVYLFVEMVTQHTKSFPFIPNTPARHHHHH